MLVLVQKCGILCGPTTGVNFAAGLKYLQEEDKKLDGTKEKKKAVFIACDRIEPYMSYLEKYRPELFSSDKTKSSLISVSQAEIDTAPTISCDELQTEKPDVSYRIDIRGYQAYAMGHIAGSINIADEILGSLVDQGPIFPSNKKIVVICRVGESSRKHAAILKKQGYNVFSLRGGALEWKTKGLPFEQTTKAECCV